MTEPVEFRTVVFASVARHSRKLDAFYEVVEAISPGPYLELFATRQRPGWTCIGMEDWDD